VSEEHRFAKRAVGRKRLFVALSALGVAAGVGLGSYFWFAHQPGDPTGLQALVVVLVLLNARGNLRQYRYALALESLGVPSDD